MRGRMVDEKLLRLTKAIFASVMSQVDTRTILRLAGKTSIYLLDALPVLAGEASVLRVAV